MLSSLSSLCFTELGSVQFWFIQQRILGIVLWELIFCILVECNSCNSYKIQCDGVFFYEIWCWLLCFVQIVGRFSLFLLHVTLNLTMPISCFSGLDTSEPCVMLPLLVSPCFLSHSAFLKSPTSALRSEEQCLRSDDRGYARSSFTDVWR